MFTSRKNLVTRCRRSAHETTFSASIKQAIAQCGLSPSVVVAAVVHPSVAIPNRKTAPVIATLEEVPGHRLEAKPTGLSAVHVSTMAAGKCGVTSVSAMATAATSGKEFSWSQDQERACERDGNSTVHGYLLMKEDPLPANWSPKVRRAIG